MNASTDPAETVTRGEGFFLAVFATFFILFSPKLVNLIIEPLGQCLISGELGRFLPTHEVSMMAAVAIVVAQDTPVVHTADGRVDNRRGCISPHIRPGTARLPL
jgi:hypothetical protein